MQRIIYILIIGVIYIFPVYSQSDRPVAFFHREPAGGIEILESRISQRGENLRIEMDIHICREAMNRRQSWVIRPVLETKEEKTEYQLPYVLINGPVRKNLFKRQVDYKNRILLRELPYMQVDIPIQKDSILQYVTEIPYENGMGEINFFLHQTLISPAGKEQYFVHPVVMSDLTKGNEMFVAEPPATSAGKEATCRNRKLVRVYYSTSRSEIQPTWSINAMELAELREVMADIRNKPEAQIHLIEINGYASPDGPFAKNQQLAYDRAAALKEVVVRNYDVPESLVRVNSMGEDWDKLATILTEVDLPNKEQIYSIIYNTEQPDEKEKRLKALPATWKQLKTVSLPLLRRVEVLIEYSTE